MIKDVPPALRDVPPCDLVLIAFDPASPDDVYQDVIWPGIEGARRQFPFATLWLVSNGLILDTQGELRAPPVRPHGTA